VHSGNAKLGFIAYSHLKRPDRPVAGSFWDIPLDLYTPIEQQAVLLREKPAARALLAFLQSDEALKIMRDYGYNTASCSVDPISSPLPSP
jgi:molybdate transport system substrate-binding protein